MGGIPGESEVTMIAGVALAELGTPGVVDREVEAEQVSLPVV